MPHLKNAPFSTLFSKFSLGGYRLPAPQFFNSTSPQCTTSSTIPQADVALRRLRRYDPPPLLAQYLNNFLKVCLKYISFTNRPHIQKLWWSSQPLVACNHSWHLVITCCNEWLLVVLSGCIIQWVVACNVRLLIKKLYLYTLFYIFGNILANTYGRENSRISTE